MSAALPYPCNGKLRYPVGLDVMLAKASRLCSFEGFVAWRILVVGVNSGVTRYLVPATLFPCGPGFGNRMRPVLSQHGIKSSPHLTTSAQHSSITSMHCTRCPPPSHSELSFRLCGMRKTATAITSDAEGSFPRHGKDGRAAEVAQQNTRAD